MNQVSTEGNAKSYDVQQIDTAPGTMIQGKDGKVAKSKPRKRGWGPVQPERKSKRVPLDGVTMQEKAQALKSVLGLGTSAYSDSSSSKTREEVSSKFEQAEKLEEGQEGGIEKRYDLPGLFAERIFQAGDFRIELAQSKVVDCIRRKVKKLSQASGMETVG